MELNEKPSGGLWSELQRRSVVRVAVAYAAVAWLLIEVSSIIVPELGLPAWITRAVIIAGMLGFPVALVLAWAFDFTPGGIKAAVSAEETTQQDQRQPAASRTAFAGFVIGVLLTASALYLYQLGGSKEQDLELARSQLSEIKLLIDEQQYATAYALAVQIEETLPNDPQLSELWPEISDQLTIVTDPPGATVSARMISRDDANVLGEEIVLGTTPIESLRIARSDWFIRASLAGHADVERIASSAYNRTEFTLDPPVKLSFSMVPLAEAPDDMVFVPGGEYELVSKDLPTGLKAVIDDYFIDKYEVTNAAFAGWSKRATPEGRERHPVTDVNWNQASDYCASLGKRLPSIFQWEKAARNGNFAHVEGVYMPWGYVNPNDPKRGRVNFESSDTLPVDAQPAGISQYGAYAMAGNVKEWTINSSGNMRLVTGGSWQDPDYLFTEFGAYDPSLATAGIGFRCAMVRPDDARRDRDQGWIDLDLDNRTPEYAPVDEATFRSILNFYRYDPVPARAEILETVESPDWIREKVSFVGPQSERVIGYLWLPKSSAPPFQTLVFVPGANAFYNTRVNDFGERTMESHIRSGRAVFAPVLKGMVEREWGPEFVPPSFESIRFRDLMVRHVTELSLGIDYLSTRNDIDMTRLGYVGISFGAGSRLAFAVVDRRYAAVVLVGGGIDERMKPNLPEADNINFAPYIDAPVLMVNGLLDEEHPWITRGLPLWNLLSEPKEFVLLENAGHVPTAELRIPVVEQFLDKTLGPPR